MNAHLTGLLGIIAAQICAIAADQTSSWPAKISGIVATLITLIFADRTKRASVTNVVLAVAAVGAPVVTFFLTKMHPGALGMDILTVLGAVFVRLPAVLPKDEAEKPAASGPPAAAMVLVILFSFSALSCKTSPTKPDSFYGVVVACTMSNSHNSQAGAAVLDCLVNAAGGNYGACLAGLCAAGYWTVEEVACIVRQYATESAQRINEGKATERDTLLLENANAWIREHKVVYK